jgi:hypothetical protein
MADVVAGLVAVSGVPTDVVERPAEPGDPRFAAAAPEWERCDPAAAHRLLGWRPRVDLPGMLLGTWSTAAGADPVAAGADPAARTDPESSRVRGPATTLDTRRAIS